MSGKLCGNQVFGLRLLNKSYTVQTATQSQYSWEKQQGVSDEVIVTKKFL